MSIRQPKLVLRESCIDDLTGQWPPATFLEVGAGTGYMTNRFIEKGYTGACYDLGEESTRLMRLNLQIYQERITVLGDLDEVNGKTFDYLFAFEVLEHVQDDLKTLLAWSNHLKKDGWFLASVPAHQRKYGHADRLVGHVRRYEREQIKRLLHTAGYTDISIVNYGFPITEITRRVSEFLIRNIPVEPSSSAEERSVKSSYLRPSVINRVISLLGEAWVRPFIISQRWFYNRDWGDGYVIAARRQA